MKMLQIEIKRDGVYKTFTAPEKTNVEVVIQSFEVRHKLENTDIRDWRMLKEIVAPYICEVFGYQFTEKELTRSVGFREIAPLTSEVIHYVQADMELMNLEEREQAGDVVPFESRKRKGH